MSSGAVHERLGRFYAAAGQPPEAWHVGPEHPALEAAALELLDTVRGRRVLEIGVQAGGFAAPLILAAGQQPGFHYTGVDNHAYPNAVPFVLLERFLHEAGATADVRLVAADAQSFLAGPAGDGFDLVLLDHFKPRYPGDLQQLLARRFVRPGGVVLLHDVRGVAAEEWRVCQRVAAAYGWTAAVREEVPGGLAVLRQGTDATPGAVTRIGVRAYVGLGWWRYRAVAALRRHAGRVLRRLGLR
jgi:predicted O-methyltransferase YrrM